MPRVAQANFANLFFLRRRKKPANGGFLSALGRCGENANEIKAVLDTVTTRGSGESESRYLPLSGGVEPMRLRLVLG
jgi:hypothetical protein